MDIKNTKKKLHHSKWRNISKDLTLHQWRTQEFCSGGVQQIQFRTEDRENGDLGAVAPQSGVLEAAVNFS
jgi:hypothetical protein